MIRHIALCAVVALSLSAVACAAPTESQSTGAAEESSSQDLVSRSAHFESFVGSDGQHYFHLIAGNGANLLRSEGYATAASANAGIASVLANGANESNVDIREAKNGTFYFNVKAPNGQIIATSGFYSRKDSAERGSRAVRALVHICDDDARVAQPVAAPTVDEFELFEGEDGLSYFRLRAADGEILLDSQGYATKANAQHGIGSVSTNGTNVANYEIFQTADDTWGVALSASNGQIIATGETYPTQADAAAAVVRIAAILGENLAVN